MSGINYDTVIQLYFEKYNVNFEWCSKYGEPGCTDPEKSIVFADWNDIPKRIQDGLERQGFELEWSDEWFVDSNNDKAYRTSPDSYHWESSIMFSEEGCDYITPDDGIEAWIDECQNNARKALPSWWSEDDITALGWTKTSDTYESGFHPGQNDSPEVIGKALEKAGKEFLFQIGGKGQFDIRFHVWVKNDE